MNRKKQIQVKQTKNLPTHPNYDEGKVLINKNTYFQILRLPYVFIYYNIYKLH